MRAGYIAMVGLLVMPPAVSLFARYSARTTERLYDETRWRRSLRFVRMLPLFVVTLWWALWDTTHSTPPGLDFMSVCFWFGPVVSIAIANLILYFTTRSILSRRWTQIEILRLAGWSTATRTVPLLMFALAARTTSDQVFVGLCWLVAAAIVALIATFKLRSAEGFNPRRVNSGDLHKRAFVLAKRMGVQLRRTYIVPSGRSRLTNAFGGLTNSIGVSDDYGKWLKGSELDFVIAHELAHIQQKHGLKELGWLVASFLFVSVLGIKVPHAPVIVRAGFPFVAVFGPLLTFYSLSRRFEYAADRTAAEIANDRQAGIKALASLCRQTGKLADCSWLEELFSTHPALSRRMEAIARLSQLTVGTTTA